MQKFMKGGDKKMTEVGWYSDSDLLAKLKVPKDFPRDEWGLPDPEPVGLSYEQLVRKYMPESKSERKARKKVAQPQEDRGSERLQDKPMRDIPWPH